MLFLWLVCFTLKVVRREICAMVTKGTLTEGESLLANPDPSYLFSVAESYQCGSEKDQDGHTIGVCIVDVSTSKFIVGQVSDSRRLGFIFICIKWINFLKSMLLIGYPCVNVHLLLSVPR